ncbi:ataxin-2 homolog isoform X3 [Eriocheir sinensis]|nr:ataxin-2 homolog isoform X3 [Eriocheir sinensis]XP_050734592.1 ataxin-2 homolog isoform X3 [Eriocheir sinensis]XP_050734601.1 ataxin-2 homolog isoform X3 [Eriocheir sinensis]XP_050734610.1 ataxin-2 homolog isoform X3 [Eriocheir sinensis]
MSIREGKAGRRSDSVWSHFTKRWTDDKHYVVICIHCKQRVSAKVDRLRRHLRKCISCYIIPKPDIEGMEDCPLAGSSDPQPIASECPSVDASSSGLSPPWKVENVLIDSKDSPHSPSAMANQQYCLKWNNHQSNLLRAFDRLLQSESFTDVTLACEGKSLRAHKVVLSACSSYFEQLFEEHPDKSPIIILKDMKFTHVSQLVNFMYRGEINITQDMLSGLLKTAETLKVKGLAEVSGDQPAAQTTNPIPPILRLGATLPQMMPPTSSPLTTALNAPLVTPPTLAPLAALLTPEGLGLDERRANLLKRMSQEHEAAGVASVIGGGGSATSAALGGGATTIHEPPTKMARHEREEEKESHHQQQQRQEQQQQQQRQEQQQQQQQLPHSSMFMSPQDKIATTSSPMQNVLTPIPHELTVNARQELPDFLKSYTIFKLNDYLGFRTRQQFWEEPAVRRILEGIKNKEIDMKSAAELLGVSYGTLYGRYREVFGYLKHSWVNKQGRGGGAAQKERSIWEEARAQELIQRVLNKELSLTAAAVRLGVDTNTFFAHVTDNGKNKVRVALLLGTDGTTTTTTTPTTTTSSDTTVAATASYVNANANHSEDSNSANPSSADPAGEDSNPPGNNVGGGQASDDSNAESLAENMEVELNGEKGDNEEAEVLDNTRQARPTLALQEANTGDNGQTSPHTMETFQSIVEDDGNSVYADAS